MASSKKKIEALINPQKNNQNQITLKRIISLFYQLNPIMDFDPVEQFTLIENIPVSQQKFCQLLTEVLFKKTKSLLNLKSNIFSFIKSIKKDNQKTQILQPVQKKQIVQQIFGKVKKSEYIEQNGQKIFCQILSKIRLACARLQQLIYRMIDIHGWKCQSKINCPGTYLEGHIAKILFKKVILPSSIFKKQLDNIESLVEQKQFHCENRTDLENLKYEIQKWGKELLKDIRHQKIHQMSLDQKSSPEIKYFLCKSCYFHKKQFMQKQTVETMEKKKLKKKKKKKTVENECPKSSAQNSRKNSLLSTEDKSTTEQIDDQRKSIEDKNYQRLYNFLQDFKLDDNRIELRLNIEQDEQSLELQHDGNRKLRERIKQILYKDYK